METPDQFALRLKTIQRDVGSIEKTKNQGLQEECPVNLETRSTNPAVRATRSAVWVMNVWIIGAKTPRSGVIADSLR